MSWRERPYGHDGPDYEETAAREGGLRSWLGGLPSPGKTVKWLLIANIGLFILCKSTGGLSSAVYHLFAMRVDDLLYKFQIWRLWTYSYLHDQDSVTHLLFNMIGLYFLGVPLENRWGAKKVFIFYSVGSILACALYVPLSLAGVISMRSYLVGASGGIMALLGACAVLLPHMRLILVFFPVPIRLVCVLLTILFTWNAFERGAGGDACHLAGLVFGIYFGYRGERWFGLLKNWESRRSQRRWEADRQQALRLEADVDRILEKVRVEGIQSLSRNEKRTLEQATKSKQASGRGRGSR